MAHGANSGEDDGHDVQEKLRVNGYIGLQLTYYYFDMNQYNMKFAYHRNTSYTSSTTRRSMMHCPTSIRWSSYNIHACIYAVDERLRC